MVRQGWWTLIYVLPYMWHNELERQKLHNIALFTRQTHRFKRTSNFIESIKRQSFYWVEIFFYVSDFKLHLRLITPLQSYKYNAKLFASQLNDVEAKLNENQFAGNFIVCLEKFLLEEWISDCFSWSNWISGISRKLADENFFAVSQ